MPLISSKSPKAFKSNLKAEMAAGKPMKQSLAIAYAMKRKAKKMADGGPVLDPDKTKAFMSGFSGQPSTPPVKKSQGGQLASGYEAEPEEHEHMNSEAEDEDDKDFNQKFDMGGPVEPPNKTTSSDKTKSFNDHGFEDTNATPYYPDQHLALGGDIIDRIMARRTNKSNMLSEGGKVANGSMTEGLAGFSPNEFDDLVLRDDLEQHDTGANSGDEIGDAQEDSDRHDMIARIMRSRAKRDRLPNPR